MNISDLSPEERGLIFAALDRYADWLCAQPPDGGYWEERFEKCQALLKKFEP